MVFVQSVSLQKDYSNFNYIRSRKANSVWNRNGTQWTRRAFIWNLKCISFKWYSVDWISGYACTHPINGRSLPSSCRFSGASSAEPACVEMNQKSLVLGWHNTACNAKIASNTLLFFGDVDIRWWTDIVVQPGIPCSLAIATSYDFISPRDALIAFQQLVTTHSEKSRGGTGSLLFGTYAAWYLWGVHTGWEMLFFAFWH